MVPNNEEKAVDITALYYPLFVSPKRVLKGAKLRSLVLGDGLPIFIAAPNEVAAGYYVGVKAEERIHYAHYLRLRAERPRAVDNARPSAGVFEGR